MAFVNLLSAEKCFEYVKEWLYESTSQNSLAPAINFVIFIAKRPLANIVVLKVRAKSTRVLSDSVKCLRLLKNEDVKADFLFSQKPLAVS